MVVSGMDAWTGMDELARCGLLNGLAPACTVVDGMAGCMLLLWMAACAGLDGLAACCIGASLGSSRIRWTSTTKAPWCCVGWVASGLLIFNWRVSREDVDDGGGRFWLTGTDTGLFGSLGPAVPSVEGELSHARDYTPSMSHTNDIDDDAWRLDAAGEVAWMRRSSVERELLGEVSVT